MVTEEKKLTKYICDKVDGFTVGGTDISLAYGEEVEYTKGTMVYYGQRFTVNNLELAYAQGWLKLSPGEKPDPVVERIVAHKRPNQAIMTRQQPTQQAAAKQPAANSGVQTMGGIEVLPDDWDSLNWSLKRAYILKMNDRDLIESLLDTEEDARVIKVVRSRLDNMYSNVSQEEEYQGVSLTQGTPGKAPRMDVTEVGNEQGTYTPTNFGEAAPKKGRGSSKSRPKNPSEVINMSDTSVSSEEELSGIFDEE